MQEIIKVAVIIGCIFVLISCSNQKEEYQVSQSLQAASAQIINQTFDYDVKIKACDDVLTSLASFLSKHHNGEWADVARNAQTAWEIKKTTYLNEKNVLLSELNNAIEQEVRNKAHYQHIASTIENLTLESSNESKEGYTIVKKSTYRIEMRGAILGITTYEMRIRILAHASMETKQIRVVSSTVEE